MCGYARQHISNKDLNEFVKSIDMMGLYKNRVEPEGPQHFYPAFGGAAGKQIKGLIIQEEGTLKTVDATWWYDCEEQDGQLIVNNVRTTFNARNLESRYWKSGIRHHRAIVLATAIGEGKGIGKEKRSYFMEGETPLLLGAVYRPFPNGLYSTAIITRDAHLRFDKYHDKAFPYFLPHDPDILKLWLGDEPETHPVIAGLLENPKLYNRLKVTPVKTFKDAVATGESEVLEPDDIAA